MEWIYLVIVLFTAVFMIISFAQDIKERTVLSFPCSVLTCAWAIVLWNVVSYGKAEIICFLIAHSVIYMLMRHFKIWGEGDSDIFLLFSDVCLACIPSTNIMQLALYECLLLAAAVTISLIIGVVEYKIKKKKFVLSGDIAVIPGFSVILIIVMTTFIVGRFM